MLALALQGAWGSSAAPLPVFVSILPQKQIVQQIGKDRVDVQVMVPPGANPHVYEPRPAQMAALSKASLYFSIGIEFENVWLPKFSALNRQLHVVATDRGIEKQPLQNHDHAGGDHAQSHSDPHIWLSPPLIKIMAATIRDALVRADPAHAAQFDRHCATLLQELDDLDQRIRRLLANHRGGRFMVFHPSWGYFANTYGLIQVPVEIAGKEPKPAQLQKLIRQAKEWDIRVIFVQPQFSSRSAQTITGAIGGKVVSADPYAPDLMDHLLRLAEEIKTNMPGKNP